MRWCRVFPAQYEHLDQAGDFVAALIESRPDRGEIIEGTAQLAAIAIEQAVSSDEEFFVIEVGWSRLTVRISAVAVAASGAIVAPVQSAYFSPAAGIGQRSPEAVFIDQIRAQVAQLTSRYPAWFIWFGESTGEWWAMPRKPTGADRLVSATNAEMLGTMLRGGEHLPGWAVRQAAWGPSVMLSR